MEISDVEYLKAALAIFSETKPSFSYPSGEVRGDVSKKNEHTAEEYAKYVAIIANGLKKDLEAE